MTNPTGTPDPTGTPATPALTPEDERTAAIVAAAIEKLGFKPGPSGEIVVRTADPEPVPGTQAEADVIEQTTERANIVFVALYHAALGDDEHPGNLKLARDLRDATEALAQQYADIVTVPPAARTRSAPAKKAQPAPAHPVPGAPAPAKGSSGVGAKAKAKSLLHDLIHGTPDPSE